MDSIDHTKMEEREESDLKNEGEVVPGQCVVGQRQNTSLVSGVIFFLQEPASLRSPGKHKE